MQKIRTAEAWREIAAQRDFDSYGSLRGFGGSWWTRGQLPPEHGEGFTTADYVVLSYRTPIAWWTAGEGWTIPDEYYSVTTSRHQNLARRAANFRPSELYS